MPGPPPAKTKAGNRKKVNGKKPVPNNVKAKRQLEKQKIEALDKEAMDFVRWCNQYVRIVEGEPPAE